MHEAAARVRVRLLSASKCFLFFLYGRLNSFRTFCEGKLKCRGGSRNTRDHKTSRHANCASTFWDLCAVLLAHSISIFLFASHYYISRSVSSLSSSSLSSNGTVVVIFTCACILESILYHAVSRFHGRNSVQFLSSKTISVPEKRFVCLRIILADLNLNTQAVQRRGQSTRKPAIEG
jgi:hypothetical protein